MLIELRLKPGQERLKRTTWTVALRCRIPPRCVHRVPHLSLYTPDAVTSSRVAAAQRALSAACRRYRCLEYVIDGFGRGEGRHGHFVYYRVVPSEQLVAFRDDLARGLESVCPSAKPFEAAGVSFLFHVTVAYHLTQQQADRVWTAVNGSGEAGDTSAARRTGLVAWLRRLLRVDRTRSHNPIVQTPRMHLSAVRVSFLGNDQRILCEYDLPGQRMLNRREALDRRGWRRSIEAARAFRNVEGGTLPQRPVT